MLKSVCHYSSVGLTAAGVGALLFIQPNSAGVNTVTVVEAKVRPTADFTRILPWSVALAPSVATNGAGLVSAAFDSAGANLTGALGVNHQIGPAIFALNSVRSLSRAQPPAGSNSGTANYTDMDQWVLGIPGLASSTGALGFTEDAAAYEPIIATHAGILQTNNQLGPVFFNLNVLKAIGFTQAPNGTVLMNGRPDNFSAVDIGRWNAGINGVITNSGTTGFVTSDDAGNGLLPSDYRIGGLKTTTTIGAAAFTVTVLPSLTTSLSPIGLSFELAPGYDGHQDAVRPEQPADTRRDSAQRRTARPEGCHRCPECGVLWWSVAAGGHRCGPAARRRNPDDPGPADQYSETERRDPRRQRCAADEGGDLRCHQRDSHRCRCRHQRHARSHRFRRQWDPVSHRCGFQRDPLDQRRHQAVELPVAPCSRVWGRRGDTPRSASATRTLGVHTMAPAGDCRAVEWSVNVCVSEYAAW